MVCGMRAPQPSEKIFGWHLPPSLAWLLRRPHLALFVGLSVGIVVEWARGRASAAVAIQLLAIAALAAGAVTLILFVQTAISRQR